MKTEEVIRRTKAFVDFYGGDLSDTTNLKTKEDCRQRLESHRYHMELMLCDAMSHLDNFERDLGIYRENLNLKWFICFLLRKHKWGYEEAGGKANYNCTCDMNGDCCSIPVYDLTCLRCGLAVTLGEDELIDSFARRMP